MLISSEKQKSRDVPRDYGCFQNLKTQDLHAVAIDGKELCGSKDPETGYRTHLLSAVCQEVGIPLARCTVSGKTNEIPMATKLLKTFDVVGKVITTDALIAETLRFFAPNPKLAVKLMRVL